MRCIDLIFSSDSGSKNVEPSRPDLCGLDGAAGAGTLPLATRGSVFLVLGAGVLFSTLFVGEVCAVFLAAHFLGRVDLLAGSSGSAAAAGSVAAAGRDNLSMMGGRSLAAIRALT